MRSLFDFLWHFKDSLSLSLSPSFSLSFSLLNSSLWCTYMWFYSHLSFFRSLVAGLWFDIYIRKFLAIISSTNLLLSFQELQVHACMTFWYYFTNLSHSVSFPVFRKMKMYKDLYIIVLNSIIQNSAKLEATSVHQLVIGQAKTKWDTIQDKRQ